MNSKLLNFIYLSLTQETGKVLPQVHIKDLKNLPIKKIPESEQKPFVEIVDKIFSITESNDYLTNHTKQAKVKEYERQIDDMVYKLYDLTIEEIAIVEGRDLA